ncbi:hypothetical protein [Marinobacter sp. es.048]|uniref:hypothetical protein n=1 Tax=Marinobacter sp. es.048 TaxID=1761795 RepID=UPI001E37EDB3|nr:hypothetical protein [Marinobacter sp. es.048]
MADNGVPPSGGSGLPWSRDLGESRQFAGILLVMLTLFLPPAFLIPMLDVTEIERSEAEKIPPQAGSPGGEAATGGDLGASPARSKT